MKITVADVDNVQDKSFKLHREGGRGDYLFVLFKSPSSVMVDGEYADADYGSFIIFDKYKIQSYFPKDGQRFVHDFMHFDTDSELEASILADIPKGKLFHSTLVSGISSILAEIKSELGGTLPSCKDEILTHLGTAFLYRIKAQIESAGTANVKSAHFTELYDLRARLYRAPGEDWSIESMSREVCLSRSYFQYLYKSFFGISCNEDIINARIAMAKILLSAGYLSVTEISEKCGYSGVEHFIRQFKAKTGVSPRRFRGK